MRHSKLEDKMAAALKSVAHLNEGRYHPTLYDEIKTLLREYDIAKKLRKEESYEAEQ